MPSIGKSAQPRSVESESSAKPVQPCVGSALVDTATRSSFGWCLLLADDAYQRWLAAS
jgi:hypothetical protein